MTHDSAQDLAARFPITARCCYLNHAAITPWPSAVARAVSAFASENRDHGPLGYARWMQVESRLRERLSELLHASGPDDIALLKNTTEGLNVVAQGLAWRAGDTLVFPDEEFPSNRLPWLALRERGVTCVPVPLTGEDAEGALIDALETHQARLLSVSAVQYASGRRLDLARLGRACRERGVVFCVDAIQALGAIDLDVEGIEADFVVADAHKWLLGPEGIAVFWSRPAARARLALRQFGWRMVDDPYNFDRDRWIPSSSARRFEAGSPNMTGIFALEAALALILEYGMPHIEAALVARTDYLAEALAPAAVEATFRPRDGLPRAGIYSFEPRGMPAARLHSLLLEQDIVTAVRGRRLRLSPHFYTPMAQLEQAVAAIANPGA